MTLKLGNRAYSLTHITAIPVPIPHSSSVIEKKQITITIQRCLPIIHRRHAKKSSTWHAMSTIITGSAAASQVAFVKAERSPQPVISIEYILRYKLSEEASLQKVESNQAIVRPELIPSSMTRIATYSFIHNASLESVWVRKELYVRDTKCNLLLAVLIVCEGLASARTSILATLQLKKKSSKPASE